MRKKRVLFILASLFLWVDLAMAQIARITGVVISQDDNEPVVGASVLLKGTTVGSITDIDGKFTITNVPKDAKTLIVSFVGLRTKEVPVSDEEMTIFLQSDSKLIDEVVVVAYGTQKKSSFTGSASTVGAGQSRNVPSVTSLPHSKVMPVVCR